MAEVLLTDMTSHATNTRAECEKVAELVKGEEYWFGLAQEYTFFDGARPLGFPEHGFPAPGLAPSKSPLSASTT